MPAAYNLCQLAAWDAGEKQKEAMYRKKSLEAAAAISKISERNLIEINEKAARQMADLKEMMKRVDITA